MFGQVSVAVCCRYERYPAGQPSVLENRVQRLFAAGTPNAVPRSSREGVARVSADKRMAAAPPAALLTGSAGAREVR